MAKRPTTYQQLIDKCVYHIREITNASTRNAREGLQLRLDIVLKLVEGVIEDADKLKVQLLVNEAIRRKAKRKRTK